MESPAIEALSSAQVNLAGVGGAVPGIGDPDTDGKSKVPRFSLVEGLNGETSEAAPESAEIPSPHPHGDWQSMPWGLPVQDEASPVPADGNGHAPVDTVLDLAGGESGGDQADAESHGVVPLARFSAKLIGSRDPDHVKRHFERLARATKKNVSAVTRADWSSVVRLAMRVSDMTATREFGWQATDYTPSNPFAGWSGVLFSVCELIRVWVRRPGELPSLVIPAHRDDIFRLLERTIEHASSRSMLDDPAAGSVQTFFRGPSALAVAATLLRSTAIGMLLAFVLRDEEIREDAAQSFLPRFKDLCERALRRETSPDPLFQFGRYFWILYRLDPAWARSVLPMIFPESEGRRAFYVASWTGFLASSDQREFFEDEEIRKLYARGLDLRTERTEQKSPRYFFEPELGIANHLASAFVRYENVGFEHELIQSFLKVARPEQLAQFVEFAGNWTGGDTNPPDARKGAELLKFWRWLLEHCGDRAPFLGMEYWIHARNGLFDPAELARLVRSTLEKTDGDLMDGHVNLGASLASLAQAAPDDTVAIIERVVFGEGGGKGDRRLLLRMDPHWRETAKVLAERAGPQSRASAVLAEIERQLEALATKLRGEHG